jgi:hypothetical protein
MSAIDPWSAPSASTGIASLPRVQTRPVWVGQAPYLIAEQCRAGIGHPGADVVGGHAIPGHPKLLQEAVGRLRQGLGVVAAGGTVRVALARQVRRDDPVCWGKQRYYFAPGEPAFGESGQQDDRRAIFLASHDIVQAHAFDGREAVLETGQGRAGTLERSRPAWPQKGLGLAVGRSCVVSVRGDVMPFSQECPRLEGCANFPAGGGLGIGWRRRRGPGSGSGLFSGFGRRPSRSGGAVGGGGIGFGRPGVGVNEVRLLVAGRRSDLPSRAH